MTTPVLDLAFAALSDPTRREIVQRLAKGAARVTDLAQPFDMSLNAVAKHVKVLERAGLGGDLRPTLQARDGVNEPLRVWVQHRNKSGENVVASETQDQSPTRPILSTLGLSRRPHAARAMPRISKVRPCANDGGGPKGTRYLLECRSTRN